MGEVCIPLRHRLKIMMTRRVLMGSAGGPVGNSGMTVRRLTLGRSKTHPPAPTLFAKLLASREEHYGEEN